mmetsp:Transcript_1678/g.4544  ORF Transcript_1678/g.4544 Transcript_1678/m.4544 type:complete len:200 (+) Transcript_1678:1575-2174(+)
MFHSSHLPLCTDLRLPSALLLNSSLRLLQCMLLSVLLLFLRLLQHPALARELLLHLNDLCLRIHLRLPVLVGRLFQLLDRLGRPVLLEQVVALLLTFTDVFLEVFLQCLLGLDLGREFAHLFVKLSCVFFDLLRGMRCLRRDLWNKCVLYFLWRVFQTECGRTGFAGGPFLARGAFRGHLLCLIFRIRGTSRVVIITAV